MVLGISWNIGFHYPSVFPEIRGTKRQKYSGIGIGIGWYWGVLELLVLLLGIVKGLPKYWYCYWVLLRAFKSIGIGIGYC